MNNLDTQYIGLLQDILANGNKKETRNGFTLSVFGRQIRHQMSDGFPLLTTKKIHFNSVLSELKWFISGSTDIRDLWRDNCTIWDGDWYKKYSSRCSTPYSLKEMKDFAKAESNEFHPTTWGLGPIYGHQWRDFGGVDQLKEVIEQIKTNPDSRRLLVSAWNPIDLPQMTLPPCHYSFQFYTRLLSIEERESIMAKIGWGYPSTSTRDKQFKDFVIPERAISLIWNQRSCDFPLGAPFNIASYGLLLELVAKHTNMIPDELIGNFGDTHIYENQIEPIQAQLSRTPKELPRLNIIGDNFDMFGDFGVEVVDYNPHPVIKIPLSN
jgi:thymidylate synthase